jgi:hypothetical protein
MLSDIAAGKFSVLPADSYGLSGFAWLRGTTAVLLNDLFIPNGRVASLAG